MSAGDVIKLGSAISTSTWVLQPGSGPKRRDAALDVLTRKYMVGAKPEQISLPARYSADREGNYPLMYLTDDDVQLIEGQCSEITLTYEGTRDGSFPAVKREHGFTLQTASERDSDEDVSLEILYRSPNTTSKWVANTDAMIYSGFSGAGSPQILIRRSDGHIPIIYRYADAVRQSLAYGALTDAQRARVDAWLNSNSGAIAAAKAKLDQIYNSRFTTETDTEFTATEIVPGKYWQCQSTTHVRLVGI
jgi:hypothetical protein